MTQVKLKKGDKFKSKKGKVWELAEDPKVAKNGATYAKMKGGRTIFIAGCNPEYMNKMRSMPRRKGRGKKEPAKKEQEPASELELES